MTTKKTAAIKKKTVSEKDSDALLKAHGFDPKDYLDAKATNRFFDDNRSKAGTGLSSLITTFRLCEDYSQVELAQILGVSKSHLCDIEKRRKRHGSETCILPDSLTTKLPVEIPKYRSSNIRGRRNAEEF